MSSFAKVARIETFLCELGKRFTELGHSVNAANNIVPITAVALLSDFSHVM